MRISMRVDYGIRALVELAQHDAEGHVSTAEIVRRQEIPAPYVDQLLGTLQKFGPIRSRRGPQGRPCAGQEFRRHQFGNGDGRPEEHRRTPGMFGAPGGVWALQRLRSISIGDLANKQQRLASRGMYYI